MCCPSNDCTGSTRTARILPGCDGLAGWVIGKGGDTGGIACIASAGRSDRSGDSGVTGIDAGGDPGISVGSDKTGWAS